MSRDFSAIRPLAPRARWASQLSASEDAAVRGPWPLLPPALLLTACWALFAWPWLAGLYYIPWDGGAHFTPQAQFLAQSLARGESPFWLPYAFSGTLQIADPQSLFFSPPFLALALFNGNPGPWAVDVTVFVALLVCGIGVLLLARDLGWHWLAAVVGALAFLFGAAMAWRLQHFGQVLSLGYLPLALLCLRRGLDRGSATYGALAGLIAALILLGRDQVGLLCIYVLAGFTVWHLAAATDRGAALRRSLKPLAAGAVTGLLIAAVPLAMTLVYASQSNRPDIDFTGAGRGSLHPALLVTAAIPHLFGAAGEMALYWGPPSFTWVGTDLFIAQNVGQLYIGAIPLLLLFAGLARGALFHRDIRFVTVAFVLVSLYAVGWYTPVFRAFYEFVPGIAKFRRPADAVFLMGGFGALLAGYVLHRWWTGTLPAPRPWQRALEAALVALPFAAAITFAVSLDRLDRAALPIALAAAWFAGAGAALGLATWLRPIRPVAAAILVAGGVAIDLVANNGPNGATAMPPSWLAMLDPKSSSPTLALLKERVAASTTETERPRVELTGLGFHWPNAGLPHRLENVVGYNPVRLAIYAAATGASDTVGLPDQRQLTPLFPSYNSPLADLLGLRFIATGVPIAQIDKRLSPGDLTLLAQTSEGFIYENPRALPRVMLATRAVSGNFDEMLVSGRWPLARAELASTIVLEQPVADTGARRAGKARILSYRNTEITIEVDSPDGGWAVLNDIYQSWWTAMVDDRPAELLRANVLFRAVAVPPGRHTVVFRLAPLRGMVRDLARLLTQHR
ncbi:MAG: hypothetical protein ACOYLQ_05940 [Hyphomicrobiaceae bacterium]